MYFVGKILFNNLTVSGTCKYTARNFLYCWFQTRIFQKLCLKINALHFRAFFNKFISVKFCSKILVQILIKTEWYKMNPPPFNGLEILGNKQSMCKHFDQNKSSAC